MIAGLVGSQTTSFIAFPPPTILLFDCRGGSTLPGLPIDDFSAPADPVVTNLAPITSEVARFFSEVFDRNSIDNAGAALSSTIHFGMMAGQAIWSGSQVLYSDGDGAVFLDPSNSDDLIAHEWTHAITQNTLRLFGTRTEAGGLNESISDVFGSMFRQWRAGQDVVDADWLMGADILGPVSRAKDLACIRDLRNPAAAHCYTPQPVHFSQFQPLMNPHDSSGIPNLAFYTAAAGIGGKSWETAGQIWYRAMTDFGPSPGMTMSAFANRTRNLATQMFAQLPSVANNVDVGWSAVGL
ncbi:M4 family metallopeptidase [Mesorhizobium huakuii]|uniref:M4 family metallopeptidase n=1 Tax=Mesorhizobium huakuii TaxID=28104 RepID=UPI0024E0A625|nr:M4 family metallopeptidase [Mesorhizobium huakuii]